MAPRKKHPYTDKHIKLAEQNGISKNTFMSRLYRGWSVDEACEAKPQPKVELPDWVRSKAEENGISYKVLHARLSNGWSYERACTQGTSHKSRVRPKVYEKVAERTMPDEEVIAILGRIKYTHMAGMKYPLPVTKPLQKRMKDMNITMADIEPVEVHFDEG